jgi:hypothetical protein
VRETWNDNRIMRLDELSSGGCKETAAKNKIFTMTQNIWYLCEMGNFLEVETLP